MKESEFSPISSAEVESLIVIAGYADSKLLKNFTRCSACMQEFTVEEKLSVAKNAAHSFLSEVDRGGLTFPSKFAVFIASTVYGIVSVLTADDMKEPFLQISSQVCIHICAVWLCYTSELISFF